MEEAERPRLHPTSRTARWALYKRSPCPVVEVRGHGINGRWVNCPIAATGRALGVIPAGRSDCHLVPCVLWCRRLSVSPWYGVLCARSVFRFSRHLHRCVGELLSREVSPLVPYIDEAVHQPDADGRRTGELVGVLLGRITTPTTMHIMKWTLITKINAWASEPRTGRPGVLSLPPASRHHAMG